MYVRIVFVNKSIRHKDFRYQACVETFYLQQTVSCLEKLNGAGQLGGKSIHVTQPKNNGHI